MFSLVKSGHTFQERYRAVKEAGTGAFSTVWLCWDLQDKQLVALKIVKSDARDPSATRIEIRYHKMVSKKAGVAGPQGDRVVHLLNNFQIRGASGTHICMVFEALGPELLKLIIDQGGIPIRNVKRIIRQVMEGLDFLHTKCKLVHCDMKPENVLFCPSEGYMRELAGKAGLLGAASTSSLAGVTRSAQSVARKIRVEGQEIIDLTVDTSESEDESSESSESSSADEEVAQELSGCEDRRRPRHLAGARRMDPSWMDCDIKLTDLGSAGSSRKSHDGIIQTRQYRAPEVIMGAGFDTRADIWSAACMAFEMAAGVHLFDPEAGRGLTEDEDHLACFVELLGPIPLTFIRRGKWSGRFFDVNGQLRKSSHHKDWNMEGELTTKHNLSEQDAKDLAAFLRPMLKYDPKERATAADCLAHPWLNS